MYMLFGSGRFIEPATVATHFHLREGDAVADFGAGVGDYLKSLSAAVGKSGKVYAFEIQKNLIDTIHSLMHRERLINVYPLWSDLESLGGTKLADAVLDAGLLANTLFQLENKEVALQEIARVIRKGGKLFVIDWTDSFGGMGPHAQDVLREPQARALIEKAGFVFERSYPAGDHHYGLAFRRG